MYIYIYTHPYKRTCIHTHIHTYLHTYIPTYLHTFVPTYLHTLHTWGLGITMHSWARSPEIAMEHWILLLLCRFKPHVGSFTSKIPRLSFYVFKYPQEQLLKTPTARNNPKVSASAAKALSRQSLQTLPTLATLNKHPHSIAALAQDIARIPNPTSPSSSRISLAVMLCPARAQALMAAPQATTYGCKASSPDMCTIHKQIYIYKERERERQRERGERESEHSSSHSWFFRPLQRFSHVPLCSLVPTFSSGCTGCVTRPHVVSICGRWGNGQTMTYSVWTVQIVNPY